MSDADYILAIDLGTSGPKVALVSTAGAVIGCEVEAVDLLLLPGGGAEQRPEDWWAAIGAASRRLLAGAPRSPAASSASPAPPSGRAPSRSTPRGRR